MAAKKKTSSNPMKTSTKWFVSRFEAIKKRSQNLLLRRPHRSFRPTRRRDYVRPLKLPGYWSFTNYVRKTLWARKGLFTLLVVTYAFLTAGLVGIASQDTYVQLQNTLDEAGDDVLTGNFGEIGKAGLLLTSGILGMFNQTPTDAQKIFAAVLGLFVWLSTVWLLRAMLAGKKPKLRDALYNSGSPAISTMLIGFLIVAQLLPLSLALIAFGSAAASGLLDGGIEAMVFWAFAGALGLLSAYWVTSSLIALAVVTLPGMYPMKAIKIAGDLVIGRRIRILLRLFWSATLVVLVWTVIMIPIILLDSWLKENWAWMTWIPIVPVALLIMSSLTVVWAAAYTYLLYRRIVDDDAAPA